MFENEYIKYTQSLKFHWVDTDIYYSTSQNAVLYIHF